MTFNLKAWEAWIREMTRVVKKHKLPTAAVTENSAFVRLIRDLQKEVPAEHRHEEPLAKAIRRARHAARV